MRNHLTIVQRRRINFMPEKSSLDSWYCLQCLVNMANVHFLAYSHSAISWTLSFHLAMLDFIAHNNMTVRELWTNWYCCIVNRELHRSIQRENQIQKKVKWIFY